MSWKFWQKNKNAGAHSGGETQRLEKPRDLPQEVGRHLVVEQGLDPDWVWGLKCVRKRRESSKIAFDIRIFSPETVGQHGVKVKDYVSLDNHMELVIFAGWYEKETQNIQLEQLIKKAV
jgi:hypothetical protein